VTALSTDDLQAYGIEAEHVIFAAPQFVAARVMRPYRDQPPAHLSAFAYSAWMVANLELRQRPHEPKGVPLAWDNVIYHSPSLGYVVATHQTEQSYGPTCLTYYYPLTDADPRQARQRLMSLGQPEWTDIALADLAVPHPEIRDLVTQVDVMRWGHAMIRPAPGLIFGDAMKKARTGLPRVHFAHSDISGIALFEEAFYRGVCAAEDVLAEQGRCSSAQRLTRPSTSRAGLRRTYSFA